MPEIPNWLVQIITALCSGGGVAAIAGWQLKHKQATHKAEMDKLKEGREDRGDQVSSLHTQIQDLRVNSEKDRRYFDKRMQERDTDVIRVMEELNRCKSHHTASMLRAGRLSEHVRYLLKHTNAGKDEIDQFDSEELEASKDMGVDASLERESE